MAAAVKHGPVTNSTSPHPDTKYLHTTGTGTMNTQADRRSSFKAKDQQLPAIEQLKRKRSIFKGVAAGFMSIRRLTKASIDKDSAAAAAAKPKVLLENTYRTRPKEDQQFRYSKAEALIQEVLDAMLSGQTYSADTAATLVAMLSERVKAAMKSLQCDRYKLVTNVVLGPVSNQGMVVASRCLWDSSTDTFSTVHFNNGKIFAIASVFTVYFE